MCLPGYAIVSLLADVREEQQIRLQTIRETRPWDQVWVTAVRQVIRRLKRYRRTDERIRQIEAQFPSTGA